MSDSDFSQTLLNELTTLPRPYSRLGTGQAGAASRPLYLPSSVHRLIHLSFSAQYFRMSAAMLLCPHGTR